MSTSPTSDRVVVAVSLSRRDCVSRQRNINQQHGQLSASSIAMRAFVLLAAITMVHTVHALPRPYLAVHQDGDDLSNQSHIFHHLDRNPLTANRDREHPHRNAERSGPSVAKRTTERPRRARKRNVERRFMRSPDYSQGGRSGGGSNSASSASDTMPTQQPPAQAERQSADMGNP
ncbi:hypothetical protein V8E55_004917 [Tylopilus felleus]